MVCGLVGVSLEPVSLSLTFPLPFPVFVPPPFTEGSIVVRGSESRLAVVMGRKAKETHLAMCPATHADLAHRPGSIVTGLLFSPEVAGPGIPMEATAHQYQLDVSLLAFAGAPALRDRICTLIGATRRQVNTWARHALGLGLSGPIRHQEVQPVLARVLSALMYECSQPSPKAHARGLRFAEPVDGVQPAGSDDLPILSFDDPDPAGPPVQVAAAQPAAPVAPAPAADVLPVLSGMTAKALAAELASYGIPKPKGPKARLVEIVRLARLGRAQSEADASKELMDMEPPEF